MTFHPCSFYLNMLVSLSYFWADCLHLGIVLHNSALSIVAKKEVNVKNFFPNIDFSRCLTARNLDFEMSDYASHRYLLFPENQPASGAAPQAYCRSPDYPAVNRKYIQNLQNAFPNHSKQRLRCIFRRRYNSWAP